jgi:hypothetical protein
MKRLGPEGRLDDPRVIDAVGMRISHTHCRKCGSGNIHVVWRWQECSTVSYECQEKNCGHVTKENQDVRSTCRICEQERPATDAEIEILVRAGYPRDAGLCPLCLIFKTALEDGRG